MGLGVQVGCGGLGVQVGLRGPRLSEVIIGYYGRYYFKFILFNLTIIYSLSLI